MQLVLLCVLVLSLLQPGLLQDGGTEDTPTNGEEGDLSQSITELKNIVLAHSKLLLDFTREVRGQLATINGTMNSLQRQLESLKEEVVRNRWKINVVKRIAESEQEVCKNISVQLTNQLSTGLNQLRMEFIAHQQMITERVNVSSQQGQSQNEVVVQLQIVHTNLSTQLANATDQLSTGLNQLRREVTTSQQNSDLARNRTQVRLEELHTSLQQQCQQASLEALQDSLAAHTRQLANTTDQLSTGHHTLEDTLTEQLQTVSSDCDNQTTELLQGQENIQNNLSRIEEELGYMYTCGGTPGWRRVAFLNMTDPSQDCPSGWNLTTHSVRTCGRASSGRLICDPVAFPVSGAEYSRVCGRVRGYQYGPAVAFGGAYWNGQSLNGSYVSGISITHGLPRQHIWTFAAGLGQEVSGSYRFQYCYCDVQTHPGSYQAIPPSFVGNDYSCESAVSGRWTGSFELYSENPLWDGQNCGQNSTCCSMNNPPYFTKDLPAPTTDDIEVRLCLHLKPLWSDLPVELLELYVQ